MLKDNVTMRQRHIQFRNLTYEYGSSYTLKGLHMIIQLNEVERMNASDPTPVTSLMLDDLDTVVVSEIDYLKEKHSHGD